MAAALQSSSICVLQYSRNSMATRCAMHVPEYRKIPPSTLKHVFQNTSLQLMGSAKPEGVTVSESLLEKEKLAVVELYTILEAVVDRTEMHHNVMEQRNNWNILLLNSVNMITLTATAMAGVVAAVGSPCSISSSGLRLSSFLLFSAAAGLLSVMNMIQPSQLAEEQRNATRLFRQIQSEIKTLQSTKEVNPADVEMMMNKVLALDRAYPLPLIGVMLEKFPKAMKKKLEKEITSSELENRSVVLELSINNGWDEKLENEMREIVKVIKLKDAEEFARLGNIALSLNKVLALSGPVLTGMAALGTIFINSSPPIGTMATILATVGGSLACVINSLEHGGQVGMVFEMYRNCAGFFGVLEKSIESNLEESEVESREHGELFEMKVALKLGRSVSELRELADETSDGDEFASKLF